MGQGGLVAIGRVFAQDVSPPISLRSISQASVLMLQSQASVCDQRLATTLVVRCRQHTLAAMMSNWNFSQ